MREFIGLVITIIISAVLLFYDCLTGKYDWDDLRDWLGYPDLNDIDP